MSDPEQLRRENFFEDMDACPIEGFFDAVAYPWEAIGGPRPVVSKQIKGDVHETVIIRGDVEVGEGTVIHPYVVIEGPAKIGKNCEIRSFTLIRKGTFVGDDCVIGHGSEVKNSIIFNEAKIASHAFVGDSVIGKGARIGSGTIIANRRFDQKDARVLVEGKKIATGLDKCGAVIGDYCRLGANCLTAPGAMIGMHTWIYGGTAIYGTLGKDKLVKLRQTAEIIDKERQVLQSIDKRGNV